MTASDPRVGEIQADFIGFQAMAEALSDPYYASTVSPAVVAAFSTRALDLLAELRAQGEGLARVESVCADWAELADGDKYYASKIRAAVAAAGGGGE